MKKNAWFVALGLLIAPALPCEAGVVGWFTAQSRDWNFIQSVGGMKVHLAGSRLQVACDVSGREAITTVPATIHSGIGVRRLECSRAGGVIRLSVVTSAMEKGMLSACGDVDLAAYPAGTYAVVYLNPDGTSHALGSVVLP